VIAFAATKITAASAVAQRHPKACRRRLCDDCCGADSRDDYGDVCAHQVPTGHAVNCTSDLVSTCHRPMSAAMTSASCGLNYEMKDWLKLDSFVIRECAGPTLKSRRVIALMMRQREREKS
jgi:hypothetical protein